MSNASRYLPDSFTRFPAESPDGVTEFITLGPPTGDRLTPDDDTTWPPETSPLIIRIQNAEHRGADPSADDGMDREQIRGDIRGAGRRTPFAVRRQATAGQRWPKWGRFLRLSDILRLALCASAGPGAVVFEGAPRSGANRRSISRQLLRQMTERAATAMLSPPRRGGGAGRGDPRRPRILHDLASPAAGKDTGQAS
eukprot:g475.t1